MGSYHLTEDAEADLLEVFLYGLEAFGAVQAAEYKTSLAYCFQLIADNPGMDRLARNLGPGVRRYEHAQHVIFYEEEPGSVPILGVVHGRSIRNLKR